MDNIYSTLLPYVFPLAAMAEQVSTKHNHNLVWHSQFLGPRVAAVSSIHSGRGLVAF